MPATAVPRRSWWLIWSKVEPALGVQHHHRHETHTGELTREQMVTFHPRGVSTEAEAVNKWRRATVSQVQLTSYFDGYSEITALRDEEKSPPGSKSSTCATSTTNFWSYGSAR